MEVHTTNYFNTLIEVSEDTKATSGSKPPAKDKKTIAEMQYELIAQNPYKYTSDDIVFQVFADRKDLTKSEYKQAREVFFAKGQACLRTSPLAKTYGFGIHSNSSGKVAIFGMETSEYQKYLDDPKTEKLKAMKSNKRSK
ncbi:DUF6157 family protein [Pedobacter sp. UC225_61]|uniref:DUF6157 family protein n=1 Tax=Pedobacter sp. UC225_61 TaxID=3374623 RepID=UPI00378AAEDC